MPLEQQKTLYDVLIACEKLEQFAAGKSFRDYQEDSLLKSGVERQFEIIGEAFNRLAKTSPELIEGIAGYRRIIGFRNVLIHGYDLVDDEIVWSLLTQKLPLLKRQVSDLLTELDSKQGDVTDP